MSCELAIVCYELSNRLLTGQNIAHLRLNLTGSA